MNTKTLSLTLLSLLVGASALAPSSAFAERENNSYREGKQQSSNDARDNRPETKSQRSEKKISQRLEQKRPQAVDKYKTQRTGQKTPQRVERRSLQQVENNKRQHTERKSPQFVENKAPQRAARNENREQQNVRKSEHERNKAISRHQVETRRSFHVERPQHVVKPRYYRTVPRSRYYLGLRVYRPHGYLYPGFGFYYSDHDAFRWLAFTMLTLTIIDHLDEHQQRMHEQALIRATSAEVGDTLYWDERRASGSVTVLYIGTDSRGREYREFRQTVSTNGRTETSYGSAYLKFNGNWEVARLD